MYPCFHGKTIFEILDNTSLLEGDIVRYLRQILDRLMQIRNATDDRELVDKLEYAKERIIACLKEIDVV